ncbi:MAG TPA: hypothetical protein VFB63_17685, partial [Bryobacteraceae bacterium]|nr:hypothetical protein [Bryobacteraceae bacterium]
MKIPASLDHYLQDVVVNIAEALRLCAGAEQLLTASPSGIALGPAQPLVASEQMKNTRQLTRIAWLHKRARLAVDNRLADPAGIGTGNR